MFDVKINYAMGQFNESLKKAAEAFKVFGNIFVQVQQREVESKKARKANTRRLRYTLKAHSR